MFLLQVTELHVGILPGDVIEMYSALMRFTDNVHPEMLDNVNRVLGACTKALAGRCALQQHLQHGLHLPQILQQSCVLLLTWCHLVLIYSSYASMGEASCCSMHWHVKCDRHTGTECIS